MSNSNLTDRLCKQLSEMIAAYPPLSEMLRFLAVLKLLQYGTCSEPVYMHVKENFQKLSCRRAANNRLYSALNPLKGRDVNWLHLAIQV